MSMLTYLASDTPFSIGEFVTPPEKVYENYFAYSKSNNYAKPKWIYVAAPYSFDEKLHKTNCPVHYYRNHSDIHHISIMDYVECNPPTRLLPDVGEAELQSGVSDMVIAKQDVRKQFSKKHIYFLGMSPVDEIALRDYLCAHLQPNEKVELYDCWALTESEERNTNWDTTVDLQCYLEKGDVLVPTSRYAQTSRKHFVTYKAPTTMTYKSNYIMSENVITVCADDKSEHIPYSIARQIIGKP